MSFNAMSKHVIWDEALVLHDDGAAITADGGGQYTGADRFVDLSAPNISSAATQPGGPDVWGLMMIDISIIDLSSSDELYWFLLQSSSDAAFASDIVTVAAFPAGDAVGLPGGGDVDVGVGQYTIPFRWWQLDDDNAARRYARIFFDVNGTTPSINSIVRLGKM